VRFDEHLDPELTGALPATDESGCATLTPETIPELREVFSEATRRAPVAPEDAVAIRDHRVPGPPGAPPVLLREYRPRGGATHKPALYWMHGGGMVLGHVDQDDLMCCSYASQLDCAVWSVDYRLAPEHPFPAPVSDCYAGLMWLAAHASQLGVDADRLIVAGASAGGGLAAALSLLARDVQEPKIAFQCLIYPMLDDRNQTPSSREFSGIPTWSREANLVAWDALLGARRGGPEVSPYAAPARAADLSRLPPALVQVGELEVFRDEVVDYAARLLKAGVSVELHVYAGAFHGAENAAPQSEVGRHMISDRMSALRRHMHRSEPA
jgi:acetyl esterase/lipase